jgi:hypothetical protein
MLMLMLMLMIDNGVEAEEEGSKCRELEARRMARIPIPSIWE